MLCLLSLINPSKALIDAPFWSDPSTGFAIGGFDTVAYFTDGRSRLGEAEHEHVWAGTAWRFVSAGNLDAFKDAPEIYAPQFGGHGAYGASRDLWNQGNPRIWAVHGGRLYLFFSVRNRDAWRTDPDTFIAAAREHWRRRDR